MHGQLGSGGRASAGGFELPQIISVLDHATSIATAARTTKMLKLLSAEFAIPRLFDLYGKEFKYTMVVDSISYLVHKPLDDCCKPSTD